MDKRILASLQMVHPHSLSQKHPTKRSTSGEFKSLLEKELEPTSPLKVSKHAEGRMLERGILINEMTWQKISDKVQQAKKMGINDSLVLTSEAALIISAKNETVITALKREEANEQIFTNINGTIVIEENTK
ncbi:TIGR02530 family flagellar biosynthesis protein [Alkalihalobacillus sp. 1P02AB]|uniref:TIGR02530 family flagellar biosynthesis protein n=1 Tax=Alkalihalobacillus sp. 1P02AB TaxID=3132260 RepID=UPI0039A6151E